MLKNKNVLRLLSLVIALFLWFYVVAVENPLSEKRISKIPIQFVNYQELEKRGLAIDYSDIKTMDIVVSGARSDVMKINAQDVVATADVSGYGKGKNYVAVSVKLPRKVELIEQKIPAIPINVEKLLTMKKTVTARFTGDLIKDREPKLFSQDVKEVDVTGPTSQVAKVYKVCADVEIAKLKEQSKKYTIKLRAYDSKGKEVTGVKFSTKKINVQAGLYSIKEVPLSLDLKGEPPAEYRISALDSPKTVKIVGFSNELKKIEKLVSNPIYLDDLKESKKIPISILLPEGVELFEPENVNLEVEIKGLDSKEFLVSSSNVNVKGLASDKNISIASESLKVKVVMRNEHSSAISAGDVKLYVDVTGLDSGEHKVKVRVEFIDYIADASVEPEDILVKID
ncbi:MAG: CdaR family protein [Eubacteriales bacterium]